MLTSDARQTLQKVIDELPDDRLQQLAQYAEILRRDEFVRFDEWAQAVARDRGFIWSLLVRRFTMARPGNQRLLAV